MRRGAIYLCKGDDQGEKERLIHETARLDVMPILVYRDDCSRSFLERDLDRLISTLRDNDVEVIVTSIVKLGLSSLRDLAKMIEELGKHGIDLYLIELPTLSSLPIDVKVKILVELSSVKFSQLIKDRLEELKRSGKLYHRPTLLHYVALYITGKRSLAELDNSDLARAVDLVRSFLARERLTCKSLRELYARFLREFSFIWDKYPNAPRSFKAFYSLYRHILSVSRDRQS